MEKFTVSMTKLDFDHTDTVFSSLFFILLFIKIYFFCLSKFSDYPPDENSRIRTGTRNGYMSI